MKLKVISRSEIEYTKENATDISKIFHNYQPKNHPLEKAREVNHNQ